MKLSLYWYLFQGNFYRNFLSILTPRDPWHRGISLSGVKDWDVKDTAESSSAWCQGHRWVKLCMVSRTRAESSSARCQGHHWVKLRMVSRTPLSQVPHGVRDTAESSSEWCQGHRWVKLRMVSRTPLKKVLRCQWYCKATPVLYHVLWLAFKMDTCTVLDLPNSNLKTCFPKAFDSVSLRL